MATWLVRYQEYRVSAPDVFHDILVTADRVIQAVELADNEMRRRYPTTWGRFALVAVQ